MSANNQTLIKQHEGKFYVFTDLMAESGGERNVVHKKHAAGVFDNRDEAFEFALEADSKVGQFEEGTEYGVQFNRLCKDDSEVFII